MNYAFIPDDAKKTIFGARTSGCRRAADDPR